MSTLTREQIEQASGRELDALVHSTLFNPDEWVVIKRGLFYRPGAKGYTSNEAEAGVYTEAEARAHEYPHDEPVSIRRKTIPAYSASGDAMLAVLERMRELGWDWDVETRGESLWGANCYQFPEGQAPLFYEGDSEAPTLALAVCRAALLAILSQKEGA